MPVDGHPTTDDRPDFTARRPQYLRRGYVRVCTAVRCLTVVVRFLFTGLVHSATVGVGDIDRQPVVGADVFQASDDLRRRGRTFIVRGRGSVHSRPGAADRNTLVTRVRYYIRQ